MVKALRSIFNQLIKAILHSWEGLKFAWGFEFSFRLEIFLAFGAFLIANFLANNAFDVIYLMTPIVITMAFELCNTSIEKTIDTLGKGQIKDSFKSIKDCASAAVFVMVLWSLITWFFYFFR